MAGAAGALDGIRVLDLATPLAEATGRVFADLGAEVIKIEPPGGCGSRFEPPFDGVRPEGDPERSLFWRAWGRGKRSVVLDLDQPAARTRFLALVDVADVVIESFAPGTLDAWGLGAAALRARNPALLVVSVTPFGQHGAEARHPATDLTLAAAGGLLNMQGDGDRPPLPVGFPETAHHGAVQAAADALLALCERDRSGQGQHLDTSAQAAVVGTLMFVTGYAALDENPPGFGEERGARKTVQEVAPGLALPVIEPCRDGFVAMTLVLGAQGAHGFAAAMRWIGEQGGLDDELRAIEWETWIQQIQAGTLAVETARRGVDQFLAHLRTMTKAEIHAQAVAQKWLIAPIQNAADLRHDPQLAARNFWVEVEGHRLPGPFARLSATPIRYEGGAPTLGADQELLDALSARASPQPKAPPGDAASSPGAVFDGLKVADFSWIAAGPLITRDLANLGATVVRVESEKRVDTIRFIPPFKGPPGLRTGITAANTNQSKLGLGLDFTHPQGLAVAHRLAEWADVVVENFTPGTAERLGIDYATLSARNPGLVMLYTCMRGQTGPERAHTGFGLHGAALGGFVAITGWPDRKPQAPWGAYTDYISPRFALCALGAALHHRHRTGAGQCIDLSQIEASLHFLAPLLLDHDVNGRVLERAGLDSERGCPHGVYAAGGAERYLAIEARSADQWRALCATVPALATLDRDAAGLDALPARLARRAELDRTLASWCAGREPFATARALREAGVPAYVPLRATDLHADPSLAAHGYFVELPHTEMGPLRYDGAVTRFSKTPARPTHAGPTSGEHTFEVMTRILGYSEHEVSEIAASGALT